MAIEIKIIKSNTSKTVGKNTVLIPWKIQNGIINCEAMSFNFLTHGEYGLNLIHNPSIFFISVYDEMILMVPI